MQRSSNLGILKALIITAIVFFSLPQLSSAYGQDRWYAHGYTDPHWENAGEIYTIDPAIAWRPGGDRLFEYVGVIVSAEPLYWVQLGYVVRREWWGGFFPPKYYREKNDSYGYDQYIFDDGPDENSWHIYAIENRGVYTPSDTYDLWIDRDRGSYTVYPYYPVLRMDASVETTNPDIDIDGSHFRELMYYDLEYIPDGGKVWYYWSNSWPGYTPPYRSRQITPSEFEMWKE